MHGDESPLGKAARTRRTRKRLAERVGFEPTEACTSPHFECGALDHYATSPREDYVTFQAQSVGTFWNGYTSGHLSRGEG